MPEENHSNRKFIREPVCRFPALPEKTDAEQRAIERVLLSGVMAPESAILAWVRSVGPQEILSAQPSDIQFVASAF